MIANGWIRIERKLLSHPVFAPEPFTEREAWVWIVASASHKATQHRVGSSMAKVPRGSFLTTLSEMQVAWRWKSVKRVRNFLNLLCGEGMIMKKTVGKARLAKTHICVCNYGIYQDAGHERGTKEGTKEGASEPQLSDGKKRENPPERNNEGTSRGTQRGTVKNKGLTMVGGGDAQARDTTDREKLLAAMGFNPGDVSPNGAIRGSNRDMIEAGRWSDDLGLSLDEQIAVVTEVMTARREQQPPTAFKYFTPAMQRFAGYKNQPKLEAANGGARHTGAYHEQPAISKSEKWLDAFVGGATDT